MPYRSRRMTARESKRFDPRLLANGFRIPRRPTGGAPPSSTRSTRARSRTPTATASATCPASRVACGALERARRRRDLALAVLHLPQNDAGYDVADYCDVDPLFGTLADFDVMRDAAHGLGLQGDHRPGAEPQFQRAPLVPGGAGRRAGLARARPLHVPRRARASTASCRPTTGTPSSAAPPGLASPRPTERPAPGTCTSSTPRSPTSTGRTRGCTSSSATSCGSGSTAASTASGWMSRTALVKVAGLPDYTPAAAAAAWAAATDDRLPRIWAPQDRACTRSTATGTGCWPSSAPTASCAPRRGSIPLEQARRLGAPRRDAARRSTSATSRRRGRPQRCARSSTSRSPRSAASAHPAPGCSRTTTSSGTPAASHSPRPRCRAPASDRDTEPQAG